MSTPAAKYRRISNDREGRELGIERQDQDLDDLGVRRGLTYVGDYFDNDISASTKSRKPRPGYQRMLADAKAGRFKVIAAYTTSRITRRPREFEDLIDLAVQHGIEFQYVRSPEFDLSTAQGRRVARTLAAQDAGEAEETSERVARAALQRAERGEWHGGHRAFGYTRDGMSVDPAEAAHLVYAYGQLLAGVPTSSIARDLTARGITATTGNPFTYSTLARMLRNPRNCALRVHRGEIVGPASWPAIVDESTWRAAVAILTDPARRTTTGNRASYLLSGLAICGGCGRTITSGGVKRSSAGTTTYRRIYVCRANKCVGRRQDWVDEFVGAVVVERLSRPDARDLLVDEQTPDLAALRTEAAALRVRLDELADAFASDEITRMQLTRATEKMRGRLDEIEAAQVHVSRAPVLAELVTAEDVGAAWTALPLDRQRAVVDVLMTVTLHPGGGGRRTFDPSKVEITWRTS
jgi:site-specific DNA recombinase